MSEEQQPEFQSLLQAARNIESPTDRAAFLNRACGEDSELHRRIEQHLSSQEKEEISGNSSAPEHEATMIGEQSDSDAIDANRSILNLLGQSLDRVPHVLLRDEGQESDDPMVRPHLLDNPQRRDEGRYLLQGEIARGGMGAILKGRDNDLGRDLAVKVLLESHKNKPEVIQRFIEEAQIAGQLQHPGIAPVYELGQFTDQRPFFAMKLIKGKTLSSLLAERENPAEDRARFLGIFEQICQTMAYAHSRGVIHRDLKPPNMMVGAFGEVQVMDWGLAKVLSERGVADEQKAQPRQKDVSVIETVRSMDSDLPRSFGSQTLMGSVLGTPAYMAPEQALGEIDRMDHRTDVFGLGAILCEILTSQPPYAGEDGTAVFRLATRGKLEDCFERLAACGADPDLVELARNCLELEPNDRPRDAGVLAERITRYLESVETKLRETEIARAAASARAEEERKRRRVMLALAASVLLTICLGGGSWVWFEQQQAKHRSVTTTRVNEMVSEARLHRQLADKADISTRLQELEIAVGDARQAVKLAEEEQVDAATRQTAGELLSQLEAEAATARQQAQQSDADRRLQERLDRIRLSQSGGIDQQSNTTLTGDWSHENSFVEIFDLYSAAEQYEEAFREAELDPLALEVGEVAARIEKSAIRESLIGALDNWTRALKPGQQDLRARLLAVADAADPSSWRKQLRAALAAGDIDHLKQLAYEEEAGRQSPELIAWLGAALRQAQHGDISYDVLRKVHEEYPSDFWLNYEMGRTLVYEGHVIESLGYIRAAVAVRPESNSARFYLAQILYSASRFDESGRIISNLRVQQPRDIHLQLWHAHVLQRQKKLDEAIGEFRNMIERNPELTGPYLNLGSMLHQQGKLDEALALFQKVIQLNPNLYKAHCNMGIVLNRQGRHAEAVVHVQKAIELNPTFAKGYYTLGDTFKKQDMADQAIAAFETSIDLNPNYPLVHTNLGLLLLQRKDVDEAIPYLQKAIELDPTLTVAHIGIGNVQYIKRNFEEAIAHYLTAIELDPNLADTYINLGLALQAQGKPSEAIVQFEKALELDPNVAETYTGLGQALQKQGKLSEAIAQYEKSLELDPNSETVPNRLARSCNDLAWSLVHHSDISAEDIGQALKLAKQACEYGPPKHSEFQSTLGVALYRTNDWKSAREALEKSIKFGRNRPVNWLPLAMTLWQLGEQEEARTYWDKAIQWRKTHKPAEDIRELFEEAEKLLEPAAKTTSLHQSMTNRPKNL